MAEERKVDIEQIERAVIWWQQQSFISDPFRRTHGLTCGADHGHHVLLFPIRSDDGRIVLRCPNANCAYEQTHIPPVVFRAYERAQKSRAGNQGRSE